MIKSFFSSVFLIIIIFFSLTPALAAVSIPFSEKDAGVGFEVEKNTIITDSFRGNDDGADSLLDIALMIFSFGKIIMAPLAVLLIIYAGVRIVSSGAEDDSISSSKKQVIYGFVALIITLMIEPLILNIFYGGGEINSQLQGISQPQTAYNSLLFQSQGLIEWGKALAVIIAIGYVIYAGVRIIFAMGDEDGVSEGRKMIPPVVIGLLVLAFNEFVINEVIYNIYFDGAEIKYSASAQEANSLIRELVAFFQYLLGFVAIIAFSLLVYGGLLYVLSYGDDDRAESGKKTFKNAAIGIFVIIISYALSASLVSFSLF